MGTDVPDTDAPQTDAPGTDAPGTDAPTGVRLRPVHTRTTVLGLLLVVAALVVMFAVQFVTGPSDDAFLMVPVAIIAAVAAGLAWRFGTWSKVLAAVIALVLFLPLSLMFVPSLADPENFVRFVGGTTALAGAVIAFFGAVAAVVKRRDMRHETTFIERQIRVGALGVVGLLALVSGIVSVTGPPGIAPEVRATATEVIIKDYEFDDGTVEVVAGEPVTLIVSNRDWVESHTFTISELGVDVHLRPGQEVLVELPALEAGTYRINCRPHSRHHATLVAR